MRERDEFNNYFVVEATVAELEEMIQSQNALMEKLTGECHTLTKKLEESSVKHK